MTEQELQDQADAGSLVFGGIVCAVADDVRTALLAVSSDIAATLFFTACENAHLPDPRGYALAFCDTLPAEQLGEISPRLLAAPLP